ncbi:MAG TPA: hypothetical protein VFS44_00045 [Gemmatimonadaceae bacterium]|nr:hypothetical protein [Gemmatimonadaceae bacterium]
MSSRIPLDDAIGQTFYMDDAPWRLAYDHTLRHFVYRRIAPSIDFDRALELIEKGAMCWEPPAHFEPLRPDTSLESVQRHIALLDAFRRSPTCMSSPNWLLRTRIDERLVESRAWLAGRTLGSGPEVAGGGE